MGRPTRKPQFPAPLIKKAAPPPKPSGKNYPLPPKGLPKAADYYVQPSSEPFAPAGGTPAGGTPAGGTPPGGTPAPATKLPPPPKRSRWIPRGRMIPLLGAGAVVFGAGVYSAWMYNSLRSVPAETVPADVTDRYNASMARNFDSDNARTEYWMGILKLRRKLAQQASGHVLEVSAGTGRNTEFYNLNKCRSVTLVDRSESMLEQARRKWQEWREVQPMKPNEKGLRIVKADALEEIPPAPPSSSVDKEEGEPDYYDTVVQTMGLCSTPQPEKLLEAMGEAVKDDGRILLLEHGKAKYNWLNVLLDRTAPGHADRYGCWWNKDIDGIVHGAKGLEVVEVKRKHFGTTWWVELRKTQEAIEARKEAVRRRKESALAAAAEAAKEAAKQAVGGDEAKTGRSWWQVWKWLY